MPFLAGGLDSHASHDLYACFISGSQHCVCADRSRCPENACRRGKRRRGAIQSSIVCERKGVHGILGNLHAALQRRGCNTVTRTSHHIASHHTRKTKISFHYCKAINLRRPALRAFLPHKCSFYRRPHHPPRSELSPPCAGVLGFGVAGRSISSALAFATGRLPTVSSSAACTGTGARTAGG